jgi:ATP-dependent helicase HrpA
MNQPSIPLKDQIHHLFQRLPLAFGAERHNLRRRLQQLQRRLQNKQTVDPELAKLITALDTAVQQRVQRIDNLPHFELPEDLPITGHADEIVDAIQNNQVVVIAGETGSGKTTQLPKLCLRAGRGLDGWIGCTQPRRIAARSIASRLTEEMDTEMGEHVGYQVRFQGKVNTHSYIKLMTDGILLAEVQRDRFLNAYDTLIIDEAHERSLNIDFLLGYLRQLLPRRKDLKLIVTSATIDTGLFSRHFNDALVIEVSGRSYPVEVRYHPIETEKRDNTDVIVDSRDMQQSILEAVDEITRHDKGDILIFMSGERDIRETADFLQKHHPSNSEILPLYARLSSKEQDKVFKPKGNKRRIVLATNVAETSLTVPGIRAVIDPGVARLNRYSVRSKVQRLHIEAISQASANQRKGRCGRIGPGLCIRLYSENDFLQRAEFTQPELLRSALSTVILRMLDLRLGAIEDFPFLEAPDDKAINDGFRELEELGAVDKQRQLTPIGRQLAKLPIDPRIARMILGGRDENCLNEVLIIASALSIQDPRERPLEAASAADAAQAQFIDPRSDFLSFVNLWRFFREQSHHLSQNKQRKLCQQHFISYIRLREWGDVHQQLHHLVRDMGWKINETEAEYEPIHRALLTGLLSHIAFKQEKELYTAARGLKMLIFPGSGLFKKKPKWLMAAELVDTRKLYARCVADIRPEWIEAIAGDLCRHQYFEPHWEKRRAQVSAFEQVTLYGLTLVVKRKVNYSTIDPKLSREVFIRHALVSGEFHCNLEFFKHNQQCMIDILDLEKKSRRQDILVNESQIFDFYAETLPDHICSGAGFKKWYQKAEQQNDKLLFLQRDELMQRTGEEITEDAFPATLNIGSVTLQINYHFEPGNAGDGISVDIPVSLLQQLNSRTFNWLVPGLLEEKIIALLRSLPKQLRKHFVPVPNYAKDACAAFEDIPLSERPALMDALSSYLQRLTGVTILPQDWKPEGLLPHLFMYYCVLDEHEEILDEGRDLSRLQAAWADRSKAHFARLPKSDWEQDNLKKWTFGTLPAQVELDASSVKILAYPALLVEGKEVKLRLFDDIEKARQAHRGGLLRLAQIGLSSELKHLRRKAPITPNMCMHYMPVDNCDNLKRNLAEGVLEALILVEPFPQDNTEFLARLESARRQLFSLASEHARHIEITLSLYHDIATQYKNAKSVGEFKGLSTLNQHFRRLIYAGFLRETPIEHWKQLPRYLKAVQRRLERLQQSPEKDARKAAQINPLWLAYLTAREEGDNRQAVLDFRWRLEEFRVSLFAQELKTAYPVSLEKLEKHWAELMGNV